MTAKPDLTRVWAAGAPPANIEDPDVTSSGKFNSGWVAEVPPFENFNFLQKLFTQGLAHANEYGIMQWDSTTSYPEGAWARSTVDDEVYVSLNDSNQNNEPSASSSEWSLLSTVSIDDFQNSLSGSGYQKLPGGLIIQWGSQAEPSAGSTTNTINFPIAFPNQLFSVSLGDEYPSGTISNDIGAVFIAAKSLTGISWVNTATSLTVTVNYIAIGY